ALDGNDEQLTHETAGRMHLLAKHMPAKYWAERLIEAANTPGEAGGHLSQLYLERGYKLLDEDYAAVAQLDEQIKHAQ
ncbi:MAG TPA: hypothetical protein VK457_16010, partial [Chloroflexota bacterium]|nr:hypothetical protein [Chloroflexota bacterium]